MGLGCSLYYTDGDTGRDGHRHTIQRGFTACALLVVSVDPRRLHRSQSHKRHGSVVRANHVYNTRDVAHKPPNRDSSTSPLHTGTPSPRVAHTRANSSLTELKTLRRVTPALASSDFKALLRLANIRRCRAISLIRAPSANPNPPHNSLHQSVCPCFCCCMLQIAIIT